MSPHSGKIKFTNNRRCVISFRKDWSGKWIKTNFGKPQITPHSCTRIKSKKLQRQGGMLGRSERSLIGTPLHSVTFSVSGKHWTLFALREMVLRHVCVENCRKIKIIEWFSKINYFHFLKTNLASSNISWHLRAKCNGTKISRKCKLIKWEYVTIVTAVVFWKLKIEDWSFICILLRGKYYPYDFRNGYIKCVLICKLHQSQIFKLTGHSTKQKHIVLYKGAKATIKIIILLTVQAALHCGMCTSIS